MISIIIINYKTKEITSKCIESVLQFDDGVKFEIIVVDNNSGDDNVSFLRNKFDNKIKLIVNDNNLGFAEANNQAAKTAQGDLLFFLNSDAIIEENIFQKIIENFEDNSLGVMSPFLLTGERVEQSYAYGVFPNIYNTIFKKKLNQGTDSDNFIEVEWLSGAAMLIRKNLFKDLGGFDNNFFMYFEDIDLCKRVKMSGLKVIVDRNISVIHFGGKSLGEYNQRKRLYYKSQNYYYKKYYGFFAMILVVIIRFPYMIYNKIKNNK